ncbi:hypothetical protein P5673_033402 [Acropora cervicornis]|uniref:Uncharacterized protein n=1 Tax=Acropora cervicornis TaxID=6130 RepID=A0AAD9UR53_ACRCE|nr:hypothetical protein P5673_033402 [Acropora cervicornis]
MQTIPVRVDTLQRQTIASTCTEGPQYNQILTPPLASGRVHSQTLATVQYNKCIQPTPCPSPSLCQFHLLNTPSRPPYPGRQVVNFIQQPQDSLEASHRCPNDVRTKGPPHRAQEDHFILQGKIHIEFHIRDDGEDNEKC